MTRLRIIERLQQIDASHWERLFGQQPILSHAFLAAMEESRSLTQASGWQPQHLLLESSDQQPLAALPLYLKQHSYGEYVFDWGWANASHQAGIPYYPKLLTALPYTPTTGQRLGLATDDNPEAVRQLLEQLSVQAEQQQASSWHLLFAERPCRERIQAAWFESNPLLERHDCQFHWLNHGYQDFDHFLQRFSSRKRKNIRRERRRVKEQGIKLRRLSGNTLESDQLREFFGFYQHTYHQRGQKPYLNWQFFEQIHKQLRSNMMLVMAERQQQPVGAALFLFDQQCLYGRWWGGLPDIDSLHFEACYYQGIEFAIDNKLQRFDPGTQGEHKLVRGFEPTLTTSLHWIRHPGLHQAVARWLEQERIQVKDYAQRACLHLPFKQQGDSGD
ncbi:MAG: GNAT family N-acetyltransferase [Halopseudomonas sp.]